MFNKRVLSFYDFISESLTLSYWRNYKTDSPVDSEKESNDISIELIKMFEVDSQDKLMFVASDTGFGADYLFFYDIVKSLQVDEQKTLSMPGYIVYINFYTDPQTKCPIALVNSRMNDGAMNSYVFIKVEDFKKFDGDANTTIDQEGGDEAAQGSEDGEGGEEGGAQGGGAQGDEGGGGMDLGL